jgi:hypothetical protein
MQYAMKNQNSPFEKISITNFITLNIIFIHVFILLGDKYETLKSLKYAAFGLSAYILLLVVLKEHTPVHDIKKGIRLYRHYSGLILFLLVCSLILQAANLHGMLARTYVELYFIGIPLIFCILIKILDGGNFKKFIEQVFIIYCVMFILRFASVLTPTNLMSVSFSNSYSPFESEYAAVFSLLAIYFLFEGTYMRYILAVILTILSMKRFEVVVAIFSILGVLLIKRCKINKTITIILAVIANICIVEVMLLSSNPDIIAMLSSFLGKSLNAFTMGRTEFLGFLIRNSQELQNGFGYTTYYLRQDYINYNFFPVVHGEQIKLYFEMGIVGITGFFLFFYSGIRNAKSLYFTVVLNIFFIFNHILDNVSDMTVFFLLMGYASHYLQLSEEQKVESVNKMERESNENFDYT